jgi:flagellar biosynthesis component FlhA
MKTLIVPLGLIAIVASMLLPLPAWLLDFLIVANILLGFVLLVSAVYIGEPLRLSALPTVLLFATLYRLALNISTTRLILGSGEGGHVVEAFGDVVIQGNLVVGLTVFLVVTIVQFIVIAKGSERVAEVAARFTLDALPGKQMSIDADVRAGLLDVEGARRKRQELQIESRFYGALDGSMKFIKGDAIAGIIIVALNLVGGFLIGVTSQGLSFSQSINQYSLLTVGDGLASQLPALLNALAAGIVVTRVTRGDGKSLATEVPLQLGQLRVVKVMVGVLALALGALPGMPVLPFFTLGAAALVLAMTHRNLPSETEVIKPLFNPGPPAPLAIGLSADAIEVLRSNAKQLESQFDIWRQSVFEKTGLVLNNPELRPNPELKVAARFLLRGVPVLEILLISDKESFVAQLLLELSKIVEIYATELLDDSTTRRMLDVLEREAPELVAAVVPAIVSTTQVTVLLRGLVREGFGVRNLDMILQAIAENGAHATSERALLEDVRVALGRVLCQRYVGADGNMRGFTLDPLIDLSLARAEKEQKLMEPQIVADLLDATVSEVPAGSLIMVSRGARALLRDLLEMRQIHLPVLAFEELPKGLTFVRSGVVGVTIQEQYHENLVNKLAA